MFVTAGLRQLCAWRIRVPQVQGPLPLAVFAHMLYWWALRCATHWSKHALRPVRAFRTNLYATRLQANPRAFIANLRFVTGSVDDRPGTHSMLPVALVSDITFAFRNSKVGCVFLCCLCSQYDGSPKTYSFLGSWSACRAALM